MSEQERISRLREYIVSGGHKKLRRADCPVYTAADYGPAGSDLRMLTAKRFCLQMEAERPVILEDEKIVFTRTVPNLPDIMSEEDFAAIKAAHYIHERGYVCNLCPDYSKILSVGLDALREKALADGDTALVMSYDAIQGLSDRYRAEARRLGRGDIADVLGVVPARPAVTLRQALQFLRIVHFSIWCEGEYHVILGRFDRLMMPYLAADLKAGRLDRESALTLVKDFFISCNKDSDLYPGMQQGDNGQSIVLGGCDADGNDAYNLMSELCFEASLALHVIDPKINLRVDSKTPYERYRFASRLTAAGLGFPQYSNDDVVIEGLTRLGYSLKDARDYVVAACWEFIIPGKGRDIPNIGALSFAECAERMTKRLAEKGYASYDEWLNAIETEVTATAGAIADELNSKSLFMFPAPFLSQMFELLPSEAAFPDLASNKGIYNNYGIHGTGLAPAVDHILAVKKLVFDEKRFTAGELLEIMKSDFAGKDELRAEMISDPVKFGNDCDEADAAACRLMAAFALGLKDKKNEFGGCYRAGTGSAMYYVSHATDLCAGADGRHAGGYLPANYSPSLGVKLRGPLSIIRSFTKPELADAINGGPLTLEFASSAVRDQTGIDKIALLVKTFTELGGHQIQLNVIDKNKLIDAQAHPENYRNLVVRVWGWSGYFTELDRCYQDHILRRADLTV